MAESNNIVAMMFTDIVDSVKIKRLLSGDTDAERDATWVERFQKPYQAIIRACLNKYEGFEVKTIGDAFFITFSDPAKAVRYAVEIQRRLATANLITPLPGDPPLQVHIGIHTGTSILQGKDYVGTSVDKASRIESEAHGGQVLISEQTYILVKEQISDFEFHSYGEVFLKGIGTCNLFEVLWDGKLPYKWENEWFEKLKAETESENKRAGWIQVDDHLNVFCWMGTEYEIQSNIGQSGNVCHLFVVTERPSNRLLRIKISEKSGHALFDNAKVWKDEKIDLSKKFHTLKRRITIAQALKDSQATIIVNLEDLSSHQNIDSTSFNVSWE